MRKAFGLAALAGGVTLFLCAAAAAQETTAKLCDSCRDKAFTLQTGPCPSCGENMFSGSWKLCAKCGAQKGVCPACGAALPQTPPDTKPPDTKPPEPRKPDEPRFGGVEIVWLESLDEALVKAKAKARPIFVFLYQKASQASQVAENKVVKDAQVAPLAVQFICVKLDPKKDPELALKLGLAQTDARNLPEKERKELLKKLGRLVAPAYFLLTYEGTMAAHLKEKTKPDQLAAEMKKMLDSLKKETASIAWLTDVDQGIQKARTEKKCLLFYFYIPGDAKCAGTEEGQIDRDAIRAIEEGLFIDPDMIRASRHVVCVKIDFSRPLTQTATTLFKLRVQRLPMILLSNKETTEFDVATCNDSLIMRRKISEFLRRYGMNAAFDEEEARIEKERASEALAARKVSLTVKDMPLEEVVANFRALNVPLYFADDFPADKFKTPVTVSISSLPVEEAVQMLCQAANLSYELTADKILLKGK